MSKPEQNSGPKVAGRKGSKTKPVVRECQPDAAGCDIGAREIFVAVPADREANPVRHCGTFTGELNKMAEWLVQNKRGSLSRERRGIGDTLQEQSS